MSEETKSEFNMEEVGVIYVNEKNGEKQLQVTIGEKKYLGLKNSRKPEGSKQPDYQLRIRNDEGKFVNAGAAWVGRTKSQNMKLSIRIGEGEDVRYFLAIENKSKQTDRHPDMRIYKSPEEEALKTEQVSVEAEAEEPKEVTRRKGLTL